MLAKRKENLLEIARHLPGMSHRLLSKFQELTKEQNIDAGRLSFFVVGGRVRGTPIKDNTDFDVVITAENQLNPYTKDSRIERHQRYAIAHALYAEIEVIFKDLGIENLYEKGIFEIKGLGERTEQQVAGEEDTMKIAELSS